ncbi:MAG: transglycosylase SLT domain-containing protein [Pseudomonadota bacterium]
MAVNRNTFLSIFLLFACFFFLVCSNAIAQEPLPFQEQPFLGPSLIQSIRFKDPIFYCGIQIPVEDQQVKEQLEKEMLLALWDRPQIILWLKRAARYFPHVEKILKTYDLPLDLKYVLLIESALRPHASSSRGAVGYWQFLKSTGKQYGLRIDSYVDERLNIFKSTHAACRFLKDLNEEFGSYLLALSAYNMGEYGLKSEIEAQKNNGFFTLYLPLETQRYIFKIVAAKMIFENQKAYGIELIQSDLYPEFVFDQVNFESDFKLPLFLIAQAAEVPFKTIKDYNPELRGYFLDSGKNTILIPKGHAKEFEKNFNMHYKNWEKTYRNKIHIVQSGESLIGIATQYQMSVSALLHKNGFSIQKVIHPGDRLVVE